MNSRSFKDWTPVNGEHRRRIVRSMVIGWMCLSVASSGYCSRRWGLVHCGLDCLFRVVCFCRRDAERHGLDAGICIFDRLDLPKLRHFGRCRRLRRVECVRRIASLWKIKARRLDRLGQDFFKSRKIFLTDTTTADQLARPSPSNSAFRLFDLHLSSAIQAAYSNLDGQSI